MMHIDQTQTDRLRLSEAGEDPQEMRAQFAFALSKANCELRLYRTLFWCLLAFASVAAIFHILQR
jgi:hypothetical protein